ncbi:LytR C-terminal domain-containing protein [Luedemannella helvata]|uniref:LytR/CpsA/Psr regulator C-terminal domain-containing protein n=1 Tax=Luedemannella helvata TaxID=349315 RepID=A0ABP4X8Q0_9ACTN
MTFARIRALVVVGLLVIGAVVTVVMALSKDTQTGTPAADACPPGAVPAQAKMPERSQVKLRVYNGTKRPGLANTVGAEFKQRGFVVTKMNTAPGKRTYDEIAIVKFGPRSLGAAQLVNANFLGEADMQFDIKRKDDLVDVILGNNFQQLATRIEVNQSIAALQEPELPPGTCAAPES